MHSAVRVKRLNLVLLIILQTCLRPNKQSATVVTLQKEFSPNMESLRKLCLIMNLNILERITNCLQNNGISNMTHLVLITQNLMGKFKEPSRQ